MFRRSYAVYIYRKSTGITGCHVMYFKDAGFAWQWMWGIIKENGDEKDVTITDVRRID